MIKSPFEVEALKDLWTTSKTEREKERERDRR